MYATQIKIISEIIICIEKVGQLYFLCTHHEQNRLRKNGSKEESGKRVRARVFENVFLIKTNVIKYGFLSSSRIGEIVALTESGKDPEPWIARMGQTGKSEKFAESVRAA